MRPISPIWTDFTRFHRPPRFAPDFTPSSRSAPPATLRSQIGSQCTPCILRRPANGPFAHGEAPCLRRARQAAIRPWPRRLGAPDVYFHPDRRASIARAAPEAERRPVGSGRPFDSRRRPPSGPAAMTRRRSPANASQGPGHPPRAGAELAEGPGGLVHPAAGPSAGAPFTSESAGLLWPARSTGSIVARVTLSGCRSELAGFPSTASPPCRLGATSDVTR